jgi:hypothetical protein
MHNEKLLGTGLSDVASTLAELLRYNQSSQTVAEHIIELALLMGYETGVAREQRRQIDPRESLYNTVAHF